MGEGVHSKIYTQNEADSVIFRVQKKKKKTNAEHDIAVCGSADGAKS